MNISNYAHRMRVSILILSLVALLAVPLLANSVPPDPTPEPAVCTVGES
jgi:hypothetical protein